MPLQSTSVFEAATRAEISDLWGKLRGSHHEHRRNTYSAMLELAVADGKVDVQEAKLGVLQVFKSQCEVWFRSWQWYSWEFRTCKTNSMFWKSLARLDSWTSGKKGMEFRRLGLWDLWGLTSKFIRHRRTRNGHTVEQRLRSRKIMATLFRPVLKDRFTIWFQATIC